MFTESLLGTMLIHGARMTGAIQVVDCMRCQNPLTLKETQAKERHCATCKKIVEAHEHNELLGKQIARANRVSR